MSEEPIECPLLTPYALASGIAPELLEKLLIIRHWDVEALGPIPFNWPSLLRKTIWDVTKQCDTQELLNLRQYQIQAATHLARMPRFILGDAVGLGKAQPLGAKILTPNGWTTMGALIVGDAVVDPDTGRTADVEGVFPQGEKDIYRVFTKDGAFTECCDEHLWTVQTPDDRHRGSYRTLTTKKIIASGLYNIRPSTGDKISKFFLPLSAPIRFNSRKGLPIPAYTMGILLGDGCIRYSVFFSSTDQQVRELIAKYLPPS